MATTVQEDVWLLRAFQLQVQVATNIFCEGHSRKEFGSVANGLHSVAIARKQPQTTVSTKGGAVLQWDCLPKQLWAELDLQATSSD
jgi:hypothetical protein